MLEFMFLNSTDNFMSKTYIITGASRGIGKAIFLSLIKQGAHCIGLARTKNHLDRLVAEVPDDFKENAHTHVVDMADESAIVETFALIKNKFQTIDGLINSAGIAEMGFFDVDVATINQIMAVNVMGTFFACREIVETMKQQQSGHIINISSMAGKRGHPRAGVYCMSKFAVTGFTEALYQELLPYHVKVTNICPSVVDTDMTQKFQLENTQKIQVDDLVNAVNYVLQQSPAACLPELIIKCESVEINGPGISLK